MGVQNMVEKMTFLGVKKWHFGGQKVTFRGSKNRFFRGIEKGSKKWHFWGSKKSIFREYWKKDQKNDDFEDQKIDISRILKKGSKKRRFWGSKKSIFREYWKNTKYKFIKKQNKRFWT